MSDDLTRSIDPLFQEIRQLIDTAKQRAAVAINAEITLLYWQIGNRIQTEVLQGQRGEYGKQEIVNLSQRLTQTYGKGGSERQLRHCLRFAATFPDEQIVSALRRQLTWTHIKTLMYIDDPLKRDFYIKISRLERWSSRELQKRLDSMMIFTSTYCSTTANSNGWWQSISKSVTSAMSTKAKWNCTSAG